MLHKDLTKHIKKALELTVSKDETRPHLNDIYYCPDNLCAVSTNGYSLTMSAQHYQPKFAGLTIDHKEMKVIDREFLKYLSVVPTKAPHNGITNIGKQYAQKVKKGNMPVFFHKGAGDILTPSFTRSEGFLFAMNAPLLFPVAIGENLYVRYSGELGAVQFGFDEDYSHSVVIMPLKV